MPDSEKSEPEIKLKGSLIEEYGIGKTAAMQGPLRVNPQEAAARERAIYGYTKEALDSMTPSERAANIFKKFNYMAITIGDYVPDEKHISELLEETKIVIAKLQAENLELHNKIGD